MEAKRRKRIPEKRAAGEKAPRLDTQAESPAGDFSRKMWVEEVSQEERRELD